MLPVCRRRHKLERAALARAAVQLKFTKLKANNNTKFNYAKKMDALMYTIQKIADILGLCFYLCISPISFAQSMSQPQWRNISA